jgi:hypothetical protein
MQASIFPLKEFDCWEAVTPKTYPALKTFIVVAYTKRILAQKLCNSAGQQGYAPQSQNMYNVFAKEDNTDCYYPYYPTRILRLFKHSLTYY